MLNWCYTNSGKISGKYSLKKTEKERKKDL